MTYEKELKPVTLDQIHGWLENQEGMPARFAVVDALVVEGSMQIIAKWMDEDEYDVYQDAVADSRDPNAATRAYQFEPTYSFSRIWLNQAEDGSLSPVCDVLDAGELKAVMRELEHASLRRRRRSEEGIVAWTTK